MLSLNEEADKAIHSPSFQLPRSSSNLDAALADADSHKLEIDTSDGGNKISSDSNIRPPVSTSSSLFDGMNSGIPVEITPPPLLQRSSDEQLLPTNPLSAFPSRFNNNNESIGNSGGMINVDNIFNAILDDTPPHTGGSIDNSIGNYTSNNSIFHNFSSSGNKNTSSCTNSGAPLSFLVPPKKSSIHVDNNINRGNYNMINAYIPSGPVNTTQQQQKQPILSKSMNTASFIRPIITHAESGDQYEHYTTNHRNNSILRRHSGHQRPIISSNKSGSAARNTGTEVGRTRSGSIEYSTRVDNRRQSGIDVPRYAGYLLKRSNNPYVDTLVQPSVQLVNAVLPQPVEELHLDSAGGNGIEQLYNTLPFGGVDSSHSVEDFVLNSMEYLDSNEYYDETSIDDDNSEEKDQCFCAPLLQLLTGRKRYRMKENLVSTPEINNSDFGSPVIDYSEEYQKQLLLLNDVVVSQIPLKEPAMSDPVPISGERQQPFIESQMATNRKIMSGLVSRSSSNGGSGLNTSSSSNRLKAYPPPPPDYIDPRDGHIWRAKYCVLEEGILYFYRNAMEGESDEAQAERNESLHYHNAAVTTTSVTAATSSLGLSSSPSLGSIPIPFDSMTREAAPTATSIATVESTSAKLRKKDMFDLSKSPMPMKKSDFFHLRVPPTSSNQSGSKAPISATASVPNKNITSTPAFRQSPKVLHHSTSTSTFHHDSDILWEKRVALDCVGAVRSSVQEHGDHAFELLAYGGTDDGEQSNEHEIIDKLILRAENSDDKNTWMFQFHLSLASYMQRIVSSALNSRHNGTSAMRVRADSPLHQLSQHRRIGTPVGVSANKHNQLQSSSPVGGSSFGSGYSPGAGPSLSHGHGRNALYRRKLRDDASSPTPAPGGGSPESSTPVLIVRSESVDSKKRAVAVLGLRDVRKSSEEPSPSPISAAPAPRKYVPPHLRQNNATPGKKYIPPHLRRKMENAKNGAANVELASSAIKQIPLNDTINNNDDGTKKSNVKSQTRDDDGAESDTPSDSVLSTTSSLLSRQLDDVSNVDMRRGGCADPSVILGSILDDIFIPRGASVVKSVRLEPYGCTGGGFFTSTRDDQVREISIPFDDDGSNSENCNMLSGLKWEVGASSECGIRNSNEDSYVVINNLDEVISSQGLTSFAEQDVGQTKQQGLFAIFDGHVGNQAARFAAEKFPEMLMEEQSALASRDSATISSIEDRTLEVLRNTFARLDKEFCSLCTKGGRNWDCGSTALAALVVDDVVTLANLGDCRGVVCRVVSSGIVESADADWHELDVDVDGDMPWDRAANRAFPPDKRLFWREITETHSPLLPEEEERIKAANGWIIDETEIPTGQIHRMDFFDEDVVDIVKRCFADRLGQHRSDPARSIRIARTCGDLAVSRAIGDRDFKAAYNSPNGIQTISEDRTDLAMSWEGPQVFLYPTGHSRRFKGDLVSSIPDIKFLKIGQEDVLGEFLLMACDGLWDVMDGDDAVRIAKNLLFDKKLSAKDGAERLAELAKHLGSSDNITVILIRFYWEQIGNK